MPVAILSKEKTWSKMFPTVFKTDQQSLVFMKKLFAVAISNILHLRSIFPEHAFFDKQLEGIKLKILREDSKCPGATKVINWVRGCFDALDRHYLKTVIVGFYTDAEDPDTVIESYSFKFTYASNAALSISIDAGRRKKPEPDIEAIIKNDDDAAAAPEKIKKATLSLLRTMILAGNTQEPLPNKVIVTMKLLYYDEVTPEDYEPNGFKTCDHAGFRHETETINAKLGYVETDFHSFRMILRTDKASFTENYSKNLMNNDDVVIGGEDGKNSNDNNQNDNNNTMISGKGTHQTEKSISRTDEDHEIGEEVVETEEEFVVKCPCGGNKDDGIMIMCEHCKNWQHSVCFGILSEKEVPTVHVCDVCSDSNAQCNPTDLNLKNLSLEDRQELCLIRRALINCRSYDVIEPGQLSDILGVETGVGEGVFHSLQKQGVLINHKRRTKNKGFSKLINKTLLETMLEKNFSKETKSVKNNVAEKSTTLKRKQKGPDLSFLNASQDSLIEQLPPKRKRGCVVRTPIVASRC